MGQLESLQIWADGFVLLFGYVVDEKVIRLKWFADLDKDEVKLHSNQLSELFVCLQLFILWPHEIILASFNAHLVIVADKLENPLCKHELVPDVDSEYLLACFRELVGLRLQSEVRLNYFNRILEHVCG